ncbi:MAG TPA: site-specific integrase [Nitrospirota bacterium]|nr:site-specific integrase [Nitrospirota bacterium]
MAKYRGVYKRGGAWWYRYQDHTGKMIRKSSFSTKQADAVAERAKVVAAIKDGKEPEQLKKIPDYRFDVLAERYKQHVEGQGSGKVKGYIIDRLKERELSIIDANGNAQSIRIGDMLLKRFNLHIMEELQRDLKRKGLRKPQHFKSGKFVEPGPMEDSSVNRIMNTVKNMFTKAVEWDMVEDSVLKKVRKVKLPKEVGRLRYLSVTEAGKLVSVSEPHLQPIVITALHTGMRKSEILKLRWEQVDLTHNFILLDKTKNGERREIPINKTLRATLNKVPRHFVGEQGLRELVAYVFHDPDTLRPYEDVKRSFNSAVRAAGIINFHFHDLRHTFASQAMMSGKIDIATISKLLGHKTLKQTMKYAHLAPTHMLKAANVMDEVFASPSDTKLTQLTESNAAGAERVG